MFIAAGFVCQFKATSCMLVPLLSWEQTTSGRWLPLARSGLFRPTAMGCPASEFILEDVRERLLREAGVTDVRVNVVWDPPWTVARMTQAGRDALESWGLAV